MSVHIFIEGGGNTAQLKSRCREGFRRLFENSGFRNRMPELTAAGSRESAFDRFQTALSDADHSNFVAMLVDSEDPVNDIERTWDHLRQRDGWAKPANASDDQVLFMTTCMETWIVADRDALRGRYSRRGLNENILPPQVNLEARSRQDVHRRLERATDRQYKKGEESFKILGQLNPDELAELLPSFERAIRILNQRLG